MSATPGERKEVGLVEKEFQAQSSKPVFNVARDLISGFDKFSPIKNRDLLNWEALLFQTTASLRSWLP